MRGWVAVSVLGLVLGTCAVPRRELTVGDARITSAGAAFGGVTIALAAIERDDTRELADDAATPVRSEDAVRITRAPGVVEWWRPRVDGIEHGIDVARRPEGEGLLRLTLTTGAERVESADDDLVRLHPALEGTPVRYEHLVVRDAIDAVLDARLLACADRVVIEIDDATAVYPIVVDPTATQEASLDGLAAAERAGYDVSISADGTRALVGNHSEASVHVFRRAATGTSWSHEADLLSRAQAAGDAYGRSVALSPDGTIALVGAQNAGVAMNGATYVFQRSGTTWTEVTASNISAPMGPSQSFGLRIRWSGDGSRAVISDPGLGAIVYSFVGATPTHEGTLANCSSSQHVAIDHAGLTVACGRGYTYARSGTTWQSSGMVALTCGAVGSDCPVALSADGTRLASVSATVFSGAPNVTYTTTLVEYAWDGTQWIASPRYTPAPMSGYPFELVLSPNGLTVFVAFSDGARVYQLRGFNWSSVLTITPSATCPVTPQNVAVTPDLSRLILGIPDDGCTSATTSSSTGSARVYAVSGLESANGVTCTYDVNCASGHCIDGVCCGTACGGGVATDCLACTNALTGMPTGTCAVISAASNFMCRPTAGVCDVPEVCDGVGMACPTNGFVNGTVCRPSAQPCDGVELCSGNGAACPPDIVSPSGTVCRPAAGSCDIAEVCDGSVRTCPGDVLVASGVNCGGTMGTCSSAGQCNGTSAHCPGAMIAAAGTLCLRRDPLNPCDRDDVCDGISDMCPPTFAPAGTVCAPAFGDLCDAPDVCAGTSADCVLTYASGIVCRAAAGACDVAESCTGAMANCPPDGRLASGVTCRASTDPSCDPSESCDGSGAMCPPDVIMCVAMADAGLDAAMIDAGPTTDAASNDGSVIDAFSGTIDSSARDAASAPPTPVGSCACSASRHRSNSLVLVVLVLAIALRRRRA